MSGIALGLEVSTMKRKFTLRKLLSQRVENPSTITYLESWGHSAVMDKRKVPKAGFTDQRRRLQPDSEK